VLAKRELRVQFYGQLGSSERGIADGHAKAEIGNRRMRYAE
jgi:hypothetical protein